MDMDFEPSWRCIRAVVAVEEAGGVSRAAERLHHSQPAITRAVRELEESLGLVLFERHHGGMIPTPGGRLVIPRFQRALNYLREAESAMAPLQAKSMQDRLTHRLSQRQLMVLITIARLHNEPRAAQRLKLTQPAVSASLRQLEQHVGTELFLRTRRGMLLTDSGAILARYARLAMRELQIAHAEVTAWQGRTKGHLTIGTLPLSSALLVPKTVDIMRRQSPHISITILDGTYDDLLEALRCGEIDVLVGALRSDMPEGELAQQHLFHDRLSVIARPSHPLVRQDALTLKALQAAEWIAPRAMTPARRGFECEFHNAGLSPPEVVIEASNLSTIRTLLLSSDRVTLISPCQVYFELQTGQLIRLPIRLNGTSRPIGITTRQDNMPTQALLELCDILREISQELEEMHRESGFMPRPMTMF